MFNYYQTTEIHSAGTYYFLRDFVFKEHTEY